MRVHVPYHPVWVGCFGLTLALAACARPARRSADQRKAECDQRAARAVQTESLEEAKNLAAEASACYARLQSR